MKRYAIGLFVAGVTIATAAYAAGYDLRTIDITHATADTAADFDATHLIPAFNQVTQDVDWVAATDVQGLGAAKDFAANGTVQLYGFLQDQVASTTVAITAAQCGKTFVSNSADVMTLPEASTVLGCRYTFVCGTADDFDVNPADGTDQITSVSTTNGTTGVVTLAPSAGDAIRCTDIGGSITLEAVGANAWSQVAGGNGIWTDVN
jgi:hypothetical protein